MKEPSILLIYTGGTIGMKTDPVSGALVPFDFNEIYDEFPYFRKLGVELEVMTLKPIDSSNVTPQLWVQLAEIIRDNYARFDGFVVLHGTDTMSYSASALSFMLENLAKPVVFTGSQIPLGVLRTDGRENLMTAVEIAAAQKDGHAAVPEVCICFQNRLLRANRTTKYSAEELDAFRSANYPALADVGVGIHYNFPYINRTGAPAMELRISTQLCTGVNVIRLFPGLREDIFRAMLGIEGIRGIVLQAYGSGNAPTAPWFISALKEAVDRGIVVMDVTQCVSGMVSMGLYETGLGLHSAGVVSGRDITTEAALAKMMYLLGKGLPPKELVSQLNTSLRGECSA